MKKYLFNEDGTIKTLNMLALIIIILVIAIILIYLLVFKDKNITGGSVRVISKDITSTINMCKDCSMEFKSQELELVTNQEYPLEDILDVKNISLASVKFEGYNSEYLSITTTRDKGLVIKTKDIIGKTKLKATYDKIVKEIEVNISEGEILSLSLLDHPYYIYLDKYTPIEVNSNPQGIDVSKLDFKVDNENIVTISDGKLYGKMFGSCKLYLTYNEETYEQDIYVVNDLIKVQLKNSKTLDDVYKIKIDNKNDINIVMTLDDNSKVGLTNEDITIEHIDEGISGVVEYDGKNLGVENSYKYKIKINELNNNGKMTINFKHPDGSVRSLIIYNEVVE